jgi:phosphoribosyl 1,2-cyclic phosphate phosphodiesterase
MQVIFLGCSDALGVPRVGCDCEVCRSARSRESRNYRTGSSIALRYGPPRAERVVLINVAPEFRLQATRIGLDQIDALLLTHSHEAHVVGIGSLLRSSDRAGSTLPLYAPQPVLERVRDRFGYVWVDRTYRRSLQSHVLEDPTDLWGLQVQALRVDHGIEGTAYGYLLNFSERRLAYVPCMLRPTDEVRQALTGLDLLVLGASHYHEDTEIWKRSVMDIVTAQELIREVRPREAILTHLSHTVDQEVSTQLGPGISLAYDGLMREIGE